MHHIINNHISIYSASHTSFRTYANNRPKVVKFRRISKYYKICGKKATFGTLFAYKRKPKQSK